MHQPSFSSLISVGGYLRSLEKVARPGFCFRDAQCYFTVLTLFFYMKVCPLVTAWNFRYTVTILFIFSNFFQTSLGNIDTEGLKNNNNNDALILLKMSFSAPKMLHTPCVNHPRLAMFDSLLRKGIGIICYLDLTDIQWLQSSLPVKDGGLGVRRVSSLASSAFLASATATDALQQQLLFRSSIAGTTDASVSMVDSLRHRLSHRSSSNQTVNMGQSSHSIRETSGDQQSERRH